MEIFSRTKESDLIDLLVECEPYFSYPFDRDLIVKSALEMIDLHSGKKDHLTQLNLVRSLEEKWYCSLDLGTPDYTVYNDPSYIADIWACWVCYSKKSVLVLQNKNSLVNRSVVDEIGKNSTVLDLGCGFGFTTLALKNIFPNSLVMGTNIQSSYQFNLSQKIVGSSIKILPDIPSTPVDLVFASEYFEHFERPIEHLYSVVNACSPKYFAIANGFNGLAIGHFKSYKHLGNVFSPREMSKNFLKSMRYFGYKKLESKIWNSRPSIWKKA